MNENQIIGETHARQENMGRAVYDVAIVGAGPVGSFTAGIIAKAGYDVLLLEEHDTVGEPVQCAGLITPRVFDMVDFARPSIINKVLGAHMYSPGGRKLTIGGNETKAMVIDRKVFDKNILDHAGDAGVEVRCGVRVTGIGMDSDSCKLKARMGVKEYDFNARLLIGADGVGSGVREWLGIPAPKYFLTGIDADVKGVNIDQDHVNIFVGNQVAPNFFAWMIPTGKETRVGLCVRGTEGSAHHHFKDLFMKGATYSFLRVTSILGKFSGRIPLGLLDRTYSDRAMLVGDAASQVKATSGGGIYTGLVCAQNCARTAIDALEMDALSKKALASYQKDWMKHIGDELKKDMLIHRVFASMTDKQFEEAFDLMANEDILGIINRVGDIDYPSRLAWSLLRKEPRFLKYTGKFLKFGLKNR